MDPVITSFGFWILMWASTPRLVRFIVGAAGVIYFGGIAKGWWP